MIGSNEIGCVICLYGGRQRKREREREGGGREGQRSKEDEQNVQKEFTQYHKFHYTFLMFYFNHCTWRELTTVASYILYGLYYVHAEIHSLY